MIDAIKPAQRADLLQLALSSRRGREAAGSDSGQVAAGRTRNTDLGALAERGDAGGLFAGAAAEGVGGAGPKAQNDALCGLESRSVEAPAWQKVRSRHAGQGRTYLSSRVDGQVGAHRQGSGTGRVARPVRNMGSGTLRNRECGGRRIVA